MILPDLSDLAISGSTVEIHVTPKARKNTIEAGDRVRVWVTAPPENGRANEAVRKLLAKALGVAPSRLTLKRGATARDKVFALD